MSAKLSDRARTALDAARAYAADLKHRRVLPAHLLVALLTDRNGLVTTILQRLGADAQRLERRLHTDLVRQGRSGRGTPELDPSLQSIISNAERQAARKNDDTTRTHHILIAIADGPPGVARRALSDSGVTRTAIEYVMRELKPMADREGRSGGGRAPAASASRAPQASSAERRPKRRTGEIAAVPLAEFEMLSQFGRDLTELARTGNLDPVIGRDNEIRRLMQILGRRAKNNPILVGEPGIGKSAIMEAFAQRLAAGDVPRSLKNKRLVQLDLGSLVAGTSLRGQFEERVKKLVQEVAESQGTIILYIDEIHTMVSAGGKSSGGAANMLKPALARGELTIIGTTTPDEYRTQIESDKALERRFQEIQVEEPSLDESIAILRGIKSRYEIHHGVQIKDSAIVAAVKLSDRYVQERRLPDKAVDLIDEAASRLRMEFDSVPTEVDDLKRRIVNIEMEREALKGETSAKAKSEFERMTSEIDDLREQLDGMEAGLTAEKDAVDRVTELKAELEATAKLVEKAQKDGDLGRAAELKYGVIKELDRELAEAEAELDRIQANTKRMLREEVVEADIAMIIAEWTGIPSSKMLEGERQKLLAIEERLGQRVVGQEPAVKAIAAAVRRSRAGLQDRNRPIGNFFFVGPTGVGKTELAKALAMFLFDSEDSLIRIDMSEYMEQSKVNTLIGAAYGYVDSDKGGVLTESVRRNPYSVVLFDEAEKAHPDVFNILLQVLDEGRLSDSQGRRIDFTNTIIIMTSNVGARQILDLTGKVPYEELDTKVHAILQDHFKPEFLNRLDDTVVFNALDRDALDLIFGILHRSFNRLLAEQGLSIEFTDSAREHIVEVGYQPEYGARPLKRALLTEVQDPLALSVLQGDFRAGDTILADKPEGAEELTFAVKSGD